MVFNITIVEDEAAHARRLQALLAEWGKKNGADISVRCFEEEGSLFADGYDDDELFFLDISLASSNGIDVARKLRSEGFRGNIIFLTSFSEYVFDGYHVQALDYLLKPIDRERLDKCMRSILRDMAGSCYTIQTKSEIVRIPYHKIMAFTSFRHYVDILTQIPVYPVSESCLEDVRKAFAELLH